MFCTVLETSIPEFSGLLTRLHRMSCCGEWAGLGSQAFCHVLPWDRFGWWSYVKLFNNKVVGAEWMKIQMKWWVDWLGIQKTAEILGKDVVYHITTPIKMSDRCIPWEGAAKCRHEWSPRVFKNLWLWCQLMHGSIEDSQSRKDTTHNGVKLIEGQTSESSSAHAVSFAYRRAFC